MRLPLRETACAIGIAASSSVPLRVTRSGELTPWKNAATAYAARNGLFAALLAAEGMAGPAHAFEGRDGLFDNVTGAFTLDPFPDQGGPSLTPRVALKYWPVEANGQAVVWAALDLRQRIRAEDIKEIEFFTSKFALLEIGSEPEKWDPKTKETADHSLPYIFARTFVDGAIQNDSFSERAIFDPSLRPLMAKVKVTVDDGIEALLPKVKVRGVATTNDGQRLSIEIENPLGHPDNPMRDEHIDEKFLAQGEPVIGRKRCSDALAGWWRVREASDLRPLIALLNASPSNV
jgi:2-methylcitrate dehydratase